MRTIAHLMLILAVAAGLVAGCSNPAPQEAATGLTERLNEARRHYVRALGLLQAPPAAEASDPLADVQRENALQALQQAEKVLTGALAEYGEATTDAKASANALLAEVRRSIGEYQAKLAQAHADVAGGAMAETFATLRRLQRATVAVERLQPAAGEQDVQGLQQRVQGDLEATRQQAGELAGTIGSLEAQIAEFEQTNQQLTSQTIELRTRSAAASGSEAVDLIRQAVAVDRQIAANEQQRTVLEFQLEQAQREHALEQQRTQLLEQRLASLAERAQSRQQLAAQTAEQAQVRAQEAAGIRQALASPMQSVHEHAQAALIAAEQGVQAYDRALQAANATIAATQQVINEAGQIRREQADAASPLVVALADATRETGPQALKGQVLLARAQLRRDTLELNQQLAEFRTAVTQQLGSEVPPPDALASLGGLVTDAEARRTAAAEDYEAAAGAFETAARRAPAATRWMYQTLQARAWVGLHRLTNNMEALAQANQVIAQAASAAENNPYAEPLRQLQRSLNGTGSPEAHQPTEQ